MYAMVCAIDDEFHASLYFEIDYKDPIEAKRYEMPMKWTTLSTRTNHLLLHQYVKMLWKKEMT